MNSCILLSSVYVYVIVFPNDKGAQLYPKVTFFSMSDFLKHQSIKTAPRNNIKERNTSFCNIIKQIEKN